MVEVWGVGADAPFSVLAILLGPTLAACEKMMVSGPEQIPDGLEGLVIPGSVG